MLQDNDGFLFMLYTYCLAGCRFVTLDHLKATGRLLVGGVVHDHKRMQISGPCEPKAHTGRLPRSYLPRALGSFNVVEFTHKGFNVLNELVLHLDGLGIFQGDEIVTRRKARPNIDHARRDIGQFFRSFPLKGQRHTARQLCVLSPCNHGGTFPRSLHPISTN